MPVRAGSGNQFLPTDISGLVLWVRSDTVVTVDGKVSQWTDLSGNGNHLTQASVANRPLYVSTGGPNNYQYLDFDEWNDYLRATFTLIQPEHLFMVAKIGNPQYANTTLCDGSAGNTMRVWFSGNPPIPGTIWVSADAVNGVTASGTFTTWNRIEAQFNGASSKVRINDNAYGVTGNVGTGNGSGIVLNIFGDQTSAPADSNITEVILYNQILSSTDADNVQAYLRSRWGPELTYSGPPVISSGTLEAWIDFSSADTITKDGSNYVSEVHCKVNGRLHSLTSTGTEKPLWVTNNIGTRAALRFDGIDDRLGGAFTGTINQPLAIFAVVRPRATSVNDRITIDGGPAGVARAVILYRSSGAISGWATSNYADFGTETISLAEAVGYRYNSGTYAGWQGITKTATGNPGASGSDGLTIGARYAASGGNHYAHNCDVGEVIVFSGNVSDADALVQMNYLKSKWNV